MREIARCAVGQCPFARPTRGRKATYDHYCAISWCQIAGGKCDCPRERERVRKAVLEFEAADK